MLLISFAFSNQSTVSVFFRNTIKLFQTKSDVHTQDIAFGKGIPLLRSPSTGKSVIGADIMGYVEKTTDSQPAYNWIAQHPPVYYVMAAIPLKIGSLITSNVDIIIIYCRVSRPRYPEPCFCWCSSGLSGSSDWIRHAPRQWQHQLVLSRWFHTYSGTNHDMSLFLFCALATYFFASYILKRETKDAYRCAIWLAIAGGTKMMTPLVLLVPMVFILILEFPRSNRIKHAIGIILTSMSIPAIWMIRNYIYFGSPLYTSGTNRKPGLEIALNQNFSEYIKSQPVFESIAHTFYGVLPAISNFPKEIYFSNMTCYRVI